MLIEWLVVAGIGLLANAFKDSSKSGSVRLPDGGTKRPDLAPSPNAIKMLEWRKLWEPTVDRTKWIPLSAAARIIAHHPAPNGRPWSPLSEEDKLKSEFAAANIVFLASQKERLKAFFDNVEKNPLTDEQMDACICMDDAVQIVAAAGSGKTSTMVAKAGYILHEKLASPEQILLLAFNRNAATELKERISSRLGDVEGVDGVTAMTFSAFGLDVIAKATGKKPTVAPWVGSPAQEIRMVMSIVEDLRDRDPAFGREWDLFRTVYGRDVGPVNEADRTGTYATATGGAVKSQEERLIANWLFYHGVHYEYERNYEHDTANEQYGQYRPDFYYPDVNLYHEHFALDEDGQPPRHFENYLSGVLWKRDLHAEHGTSLFETTSHALRFGSGLAGLEAELVSRGVEIDYDPTRQSKGPPPLSTNELAGLVRTFQQHVKGGGLSLLQLRAAIQTTSTDGHADRFTRFLALYERIATDWEQRLRDGNCIDFDDMLIMAAQHIESGQFDSPFTMILADEFQDSSRARLRLLKALFDRTGGAGHLCVVGDDWQGINRFAGADISVMTAFAITFPHSSQLNLTTTFRCPASLCEASSTFIRKNTRQLEKSVETTNTHSGQTIITVAFEAPTDALAHLAKQLARMHEQAASGKLKVAEGRRIEVLLLGRYTHDQPPALPSWRRQFGDQLEIEFRTVHRSKGLEADYVMILNMIEGVLGFPSQIADDPILQLAMPAPDPFPMAEERWLFYVAMTRARRQVRIYTTISNPSRFLLEMAKSGLIEMTRPGGGQISLCPKCGEGILRRQDGRHGPFEYCGTKSGCDFKRNIDAFAKAETAPVNRIRINRPMVSGDACPTCGEGTMKERAGSRNATFLGCSGYPECKTTAPLPAPSQSQRSALR